MKPKKLFTSIIILVFVLCIAVFAVLESWTNTPHGKLTPRVAILLKYAELRGLDLFEAGRSPEDMRAFAARSQEIVKGDPPEVAGVADTKFPGPAGSIPLRVYSPAGDGPFPVVIYYHGGGWVIGDIESHDNVCRAITQKADAVVVSVDYRLAPEHPFPAAFEDAYAALEWVAANAESIRGDAKRIFVAGDSAGGNLSAVVSMAARDRNGPKLRGQVLIYPATNLSAFDTPSHAAFAKGYYLTRRYMEKFRALYMPDRIDWTNLYVSPLLAGTLENLPPALVITAGFDVLRDEGEAYAKRMKAAGVPVQQTRYAGMIHGFINMERLLPEAEKATDEIAAYITKSISAGT